jgi:RNA 3'-terminal phosphate cyclase (ATP)
MAARQSPTAKRPMLTIDGSHGEGGGQVLRTALALSAITGQPARIERIRAQRKNPGLRPQHLTAVRAAAALCKAQLAGDHLGSLALTFAPTCSPLPGEYTFDVTEAAQGGSAGSVGLVLQTVLLPLAMAAGESHLILRGGTHVPWAPPVPYVEHVFLPMLSRMGVDVEIELERWGFYPVGGGEAVVSIAAHTPPLRPVKLAERGDLRRIGGIAAVTNLPAHIPQRMATRARNLLAGAGLQSRVEPHRLRGDGPGAVAFLWAEYEHTAAGFTALGRKGLPAEQVAQAACDDLLVYHNSGAAIDPFLADQVILPMALAEGESRATTSRVTEHLLTNVWVVQQFLPRDISVQGQMGSQGTIVVKGGEYD